MFINNVSGLTDSFSSSFPWAQAARTLDQDSKKVIGHRGWAQAGGGYRELSQAGPDDGNASTLHGV
jgi:hypothetical protein